MKRHNLDNKILCIGLPKTGTTSFHDALEVLGVKSVHYPRPKHLADTSVEAYSDSPMPFLAPWLMRLYPNAKYVLTTREEDAWLRSSMNWFTNNKIKSELAKFYRWATWQSFEPSDPDDFLEIKRAYEDMVLSAPPKNLLVLPLESENKWEKVCGFLGLPVPETPYPHSNRKF